MKWPYAFHHPFLIQESINANAYIFPPLKASIYSFRLLAWTWEISTGINRWVRLSHISLLTGTACLACGIAFPCFLIFMWCKTPPPLTWFPLVPGTVCEPIVPIPGHHCLTCWVLILNPYVKTRTLPRFTVRKGGLLLIWKAAQEIRIEPHFQSRKSFWELSGFFAEGNVASFYMHLNFSALWALT